MRTLETILLLLDVAALAGCLTPRESSASVRVLTSLAFLLMVMQLAVEGHRWQLDPAYLLTVWLFVSCCSPSRNRLGRAHTGAVVGRFRAGVCTGAGERPVRSDSLPIPVTRDLLPSESRPTIVGKVPSRLWRAIAGLGCVAIAAVLGTALPVFEFPTPTGPFPIGSETRHLVDPNRDETLGGRPGANRELMVQFWYPADRSGPGQQYRSRFETWFKKEHLSLVRTHSAAGVPLARALPQYPVLIFTPSWTGRRNQNTFQAEELASHGFVVVGIDHSYCTDLTVFPDGRTVRTTLRGGLDFSSDDAFETSLRAAESQLRVRTADATFVLDALERIDRHDSTGLFTGHIDTTRVGIFGHSFGGTVAAEACRLDSRFKACINLDGLILGVSATSAVEQPFLYMSSDPPAPNATASDEPSRRSRAFLDLCERRIRRSLAEHRGYWITLRGSRHLNFCDSPLYSRLKVLTGAGPIGVPRAMRVINDYTLAFFNRHINGREQALLRGPSPRHSDVQFESWDPLAAATPGGTAPVGRVTTSEAENELPWDPDLTGIGRAHALRSSCYRFRRWLAMPEGPQAGSPVARWLAPTESVERGGMNVN